MAQLFKPEPAQPDQGGAFGLLVAHATAQAAQSPRDGPAPPLQATGTAFQPMGGYAGPPQATLEGIAPLDHTNILPDLAEIANVEALLNSMHYPVIGDLQVPSPPPLFL